MDQIDENVVRATISLPSWLAKKAKEQDVSLSRYVRLTLPEYLRAKEQAAWLERNKKGIEEYNEFVRKHGVLTEPLRTF